MNEPQNEMKFPAGSALIVALTSGLFGVFLAIVVRGSAASYRLPLSTALAAGCASAGIVAWRRECSREGGRRAALAWMPFLGFLIPVYFLPDYLSGTGPRLRISLLLGSLSIMCFFAIKWVLFSRGAPRQRAGVGKVSLALVAGAALVFAGVGIAYSAAKYLHYAYPGQDLGMFTQCFWSIVDGKLFWSTEESYPGSSRFGKQFCPIMFPLLILFWLFPHPVTIIVLDIAALAAGAVALHFLARDILGEFASACFGIGYLLYPGICYQIAHPYYFMHYVPVLFLLALYQFHRDRFWPFVIFVMLACSAREDVALTACVFGLYAAIVRKRAKWIFVPLAVGAAWFAIAIGALIPAMGPGTVRFFYEDLGGSVGAVAKSLILQPIPTLARFFSLPMIRLAYLMLMPLGFFPLMSPEVIFAVPVMMIIALSSRSETGSIYYYYYMPLVPFLFAGCVRTIKRLSWLHGEGCVTGVRKAEAFSLFVLFLCLAAFIRGPLSEILAHGVHPYNVGAGSGDRGTLDRAVRVVPPSARVFAPRYLMPHLARRSFIAFRVPDDADYLIVDSRTEDNTTAEFQDHPLIRSLGDRIDYRIIFDENGVRVYQRIRR